MEVAKLLLATHFLAVEVASNVQYIVLKFKTQGFPLITLLPLVAPFLYLGAIAQGLHHINFIYVLQANTIGYVYAANTQLILILLITMLLFY